MHRIHLIGASGCGKTTLGQALAQQLGCAHFDADDYFHEPTDPPFQRQRSPEACLQLITQDLKEHQEWVISGNVLNWGAHPLLIPSLLILMILPLDLRLKRLRQRESQRFGSRIEPGGDMYQDHLWFMNWTCGYDDGSAERNNLPAHQALLAQQTGPTLQLDGSLSTVQQLAQIFSPLADKNL